MLKIGELQSKTGRRRELLRLNAEAAYLVAVDLEASPIRFALTNLVGDIRFRWEEALDLRLPLAMDKIASGVEMVCRTLSRQERERVLAVGISRPGAKDAEGRVTAVNLGWRDFSFDENLKSVLSLPFFVENAARSFVLAERWHGRAKNRDNCIYIEAGKGVGAGVVINGEFFGDKVQVEFGHITIEPGAPDLCKCGKTGCLEAIVSAPNIVRQYADRLGIPEASSGIQIGEVFERARRHDPDANAVVDRVARDLGLAISYLVALFGPSMIILGGYTVAAEDVMLPRIRTELAKHVRDWAVPYELTVSSLGVDIGLKGAASRAMHDVLNNSELLKKLCMLDRPKGALPQAKKRGAA